MTSEDRKAVKKAGYTQTLIAEITGFSTTNVNAVFFERKGNKSQNPIIRACIATILRKPVDEVFKDHVQYYCKIYTILRKLDDCVNSKS